MEASLNKILDRLREIADEMQEVMDYSHITPEHGHHRTAVFVRLPYPSVVAQNEEVAERLHRFLSSLNRPDTIKADLYTVIGNNVLQGYQPHTDLNAKGAFDPEELHQLLDVPYVLQVIVDVVHPDAMNTTFEALK